MAQYLDISQTEMEEFLLSKGFKPIRVANTVELVYSKRVHQDDLQLSLRVYTGINPNGHSRDVGTDAIRVNLFLRTEEGKVLKVGGSKRVHRVLGWKKNLQERLDSWLEFLPQHKCECGLPMIPRKGRNGTTFLGCVGWPSCKKTKRVQ